MAFGQQSVAEVRTDESGGAGNDNSQMTSDLPF